MTEEIKFLAWCRSIESEKQLMDSLAVFDATHPGVKTSVNIPVPVQMWPEIVRTALYEYNTDLGEVGSTYIESLSGMNSLRPFTENEVLSFGGESVFVKAVFEAGLDRKKQLWAIPWRADSRVIFYRRDLFAKAGIKEENAFQTPAHMEQTLQALQASGVEIPLTLGTASAHALTTFTACWVWGAGGDYINQDGTEVTFDSSKAKKGFYDYFTLGRYLALSARKLDIASSDQLFCEGKAAVTYAGTWLTEAIDQTGSSLVKENLGVALPPGIPIVGGTHLVIWKRSIRERTTLDLIRFLTSKETLIGYPKSITIPARLDALSDEVFSGNVIYKTFNEAIQKGRSVPPLPLWALVEDRLGKTLLQIWEKIHNDPHVNLEGLIADSIDALAKRLSPTLNKNNK
jgi:multiple sugar transport system substrate-binding protein